MQLSALNAIIVLKDFERYNMRTIEIGKNDAGQRLDKFLTKRFKTMPKALMYKYIRTKYIKLNGKRCEISSRLNEGDILTLYIKDEFFEPQKAEYDFMKAPLKLDVVYEDENILLIDKKPGLIVHPDENYHFDSALARIQHYLYEKGEYNPTIKLCRRICRVLDKPLDDLFWEDDEDEENEK